MTDRYCVFGNPIAHSRSPQIHALFARQTGQDLGYEAILAPLDGFAGAVEAFRGAGGRGANVTVPFKEQAFRLCGEVSPRAAAARAVNTLVFRGDGIHGDNTDGAGLVADITRNLGFPLAGKRVLLLGAGGAARGVIAPLLEQRLAGLVIANRTAGKAADLAAEFAAVSAGFGLPAGAVSACGFGDLADLQFEAVVNATSASLGDAGLDLPAGVFAPGSLAYDMVYGRGMTPFLRLADEEGAGRLADGLGMLVEQAAEAFLVWRGIRPDTAPVLAALRHG